MTIEKFPLKFFSYKILIINNNNKSHQPSNEYLFEDADKDDLETSFFLVIAVSIFIRI